jgi:transposase InsO family protein
MSMTELCEAYGISRKTGYKWVERFFAGGLPALADRSRAPHHRPHAVAEEVVEAIVELRKRHRTWGPKKLLVCLSRQHPDVQWPAESTVSTILKRQGLVEGRYRRKRTPYATQPLAAATEPNIVWSTDFKGKFRVGRRYCNPLTISDACSRYLLAVDGLDGERFEPTKKVFERVLKEHGLPLRIRSDNGTPFASSAIGGLSRLSVWWVCLGIMPERIEPGHPEQNGRHERMHRTLKQETASPPQSSREAQQLAFDRFRHEYNHERPHEALGQETPASRYEPSRRPFPDDVGDPEYPAPFEVRRVYADGGITFRQRHVHLGRVLARQAVGIEAIDDGKWQLWFGPIYLGLLHERRRGKLSLVKNKPVPPRYSKTSS